MSAADTLSSGSEPRLTPSGCAIGAEIGGLDVAGGLAEAQMRLVRDAVLRHAVVVLRGQHLSPEQQVAFADRMAEVKLTRRPADELHAPTPPGRPEIVIISNIVENGRPIGISDAGLLWHTDTCFQSHPELFVTLYALQIPVRDGAPLGDTRYVSTTAAYDALDEATKLRLQGLRVVQSYAYHLDMLGERGLRTRPEMTEEQRSRLAEVSHPLVRTHPITGRKLLYATEGFSARIEGLPEAESRALLDRLCAHVVREAFMYRHRWAEGDLLVWDNCATQHLATFDYGAMPRRLHRCGTGGPAPE
jgi:taurine dioxygenase